VTECTFALARNRDALFDWLLSSTIEVVDFSLDDVETMRWMNAYRDREVDFADASLVWLAARRGTDLIATTDFNDFEVYRLLNRRPFRNLVTR